MELTNGDTGTFWTAMGVLLGGRFFFFIIERLGDILSWRLYRRKIVVDNAFTYLKANGFPSRKDPEDDFLRYLGSIQHDPECTASLKKSAFDLEKMFAAVEQIGILVGARTWDACDAALDIYAPSRMRPTAFDEGAACPLGQSATGPPMTVATAEAI